MLFYRRAALILSVSFGSAYGALYTDPSQLPSKSYDYIVVGGKCLHPRACVRETHCFIMQVVLAEVSSLVV